MTSPVAVVNPQIASSIVVLPAPFGPMSPTIAPRGTSKDDVVARRRRLRSAPCTPSTRRAQRRIGVEDVLRGVGAVRRSTATSGPAEPRRAPPGADLGVGGADDAFGVGDHREDQADTAVTMAYQSPRSICRSRRMNMMPPALMTPGHEPAGDRGDAGQVGREEHRQCRQRAEGLVGDVGLLVGEQAAAEAGDERADAEPDELDAHHADAGGRRGALVGAHGEHGRSEPARAQPGDAERDDHEHRPGRATPNSRRGIAASEPDLQIEAEQRRAGDRAAVGAAVEVVVAEPHRLDGDRERSA